MRPPSPGQNLAGILLGTARDAEAEPPDTPGTWSRNSHPSSMPQQTRSSPLLPGVTAAWQREPRPAGGCDGGAGPT
jgi:hypothetical protein